MPRHSVEGSVRSRCNSNSSAWYGLSAWLISRGSPGQSGPLLIGCASPRGKRYVRIAPGLAGGAPDCDLNAQFALPLVVPHRKWRIRRVATMLSNEPLDVIELTPQGWRRAHSPSPPQIRRESLARGASESSPSDIHCPDRRSSRCVSVCARPARALRL